MRKTAIGRDRVVNEHFTFIHLHSIKFKFSLLFHFIISLLLQCFWRYQSVETNLIVDFVLLQFHIAFCSEKLNLGVPGDSPPSKRFYFDTMNNKCREFSYSGQGGNANNFQSIYECESNCKNFLKI